VCRIATQAAHGRNSKERIDEYAVPNAPSRDQVTRRFIRGEGLAQVTRYPLGGWMFEAQIASKCTVALFSRNHVAKLLASLPPAELTSIVHSIAQPPSGREPAALCCAAESAVLGPADDGAERLGAVGWSARLGRHNPSRRSDDEDLADMIGCSRPMVRKRRNCRR